MKDLRLSVAMMRSLVGEKDANLESVRNLARLAAREGADLLVLPEACLSGYTVRESMAPWAETVPGPLTASVVEIAREFSLTLLVGLVESPNAEQCFLTQVLVGPDGIIGIYRKTHLGPTEKTLFSPGDSLSVLEVQDTTFGIQLCYEGHFPEVATAQALQGAEVLLIPHASPREEPSEKLERWLRYLPARAYDNTVFLAACNQVGDNGAGLVFAGVALIAGPKGEILAQTMGDQDDLITAELKVADLETIKNGRMGYFLPIRRPELYRTD